MKSGKILPPTVFNIAFLMILLLHFIVPVKRIIYYPYNLSGILLIIFGIVLNLWADRLFKNYVTTVKPYEEASALITNGPFRFSRNPMYLGMSAILTGLFLLFGSLSSFLVIPIFIIIMHYKFIKVEEQAMEIKFGEQFRTYKSRVRQWI